MLILPYVHATIDDSFTLNLLWYSQWWKNKFSCTPIYTKQGDFYRQQFRRNRYSNYQTVLWEHVIHFSLLYILPNYWSCLLFFILLLIFFSAEGKWIYYVHGISPRSWRSFFWNPTMKWWHLESAISAKMQLTKTVGLCLFLVHHSIQANLRVKIGTKAFLKKCLLLSLLTFNQNFYRLAIPDRGQT